MKTLNLLSLLFCFSAFAINGANNLIKVKQIHMTYADVCGPKGYEDPELCALLWFDPQTGRTKEVKPEIFRALEKNRFIIADISKKFKISPMALGGVIISEHTVNYGPSDSAQEYLPGIFQKFFTIGLGQISYNAAFEAEPLVQEVEGRSKPYTKDEVFARLSTPMDSLKYGAAIMRKAASDYAKAGFDIRGRPDILATLYNTGGAKERALKSYRARRMPRVNYFGLYVYLHYSEIKRALHLK